MTHLAAATPSSTPVTALGRLAGGATLTAAGGAVSALAGFLTTALVARSLGASGAGVFGVCVALSMVLTQAGKLGCDTALVHFLPRLQLFGGGRANLRGLVGLSLLATGVLGVLTGLALWVAAPQLADLFLDGVERDTATGALRIVAACLPAAAPAAVALAATRGLGTVRPLVANDQVAKPLLRLVLIAGVLVAGGGVGVVVLAWAAPQWLLLVLAVRSLSARSEDGVGLGALDGELRSGFVRYSGLRQLSASLEVVGMHAGLLVVGALVGAAEAGVYSVATRLAMAGYLTLQAIRLAVAPQLSAALADPDPREAQTLHQTSSGWVVLTAWPLYLVLVLLSPYVLALFGPDFVPGATVLSLVALGGLVSVASGNVQTVLLMGGRAGDYLAVATASVVVNLLALAALVPLLGVEGAALAFLLSSVTENGLTIVLVRRRLGVRHFGTAVRTAMLLNLATVGVVCASVRLSDPAPAVALGVACLALPVYFVACWRWRSPLALDHLVHQLRRRTHQEIP